jgi:uncharacterized membrane protein
MLRCQKIGVLRNFMKIKKEIEDTIKTSKSTLTLTLLDFGTKKNGNNRRLLYDQRSVINDRCNYLRKIRKFRSKTITLGLYNAGIS